MRKYFMISYFIMNIFSNFFLYGQSFSLGWSGIDIIPKALFSDSTKWNHGASSGDSCFVTTDTANVYLHWKFGSGNRAKWALCFHVLDIPIVISDLNIVGIDVKGAQCNSARNVRIKFEDGTNQASFIWHGLASLTRWCERLVVLKNQFQGNINWNNVKVISLEVSSDASASDIQKDSGIVVFRKLQMATISDWQRAASFETLKDTSILDTIKNQALSGILARQASTGLFYTWLEDHSSWLYGQGLLLKLLTIEGQWEKASPINPCGKAAEKLALFLAGHQDVKGFWPRAWNADNGNINVYVESDGTIWMGDFPWIITGLVNYYAKTGDVRVLGAIQKARNFLYNLVNANGQFFTLNINTNTKVEVTSAEAYAAAIISIYELGDSARASTMLNYISSQTWDNNLKYWKEAIYSPRIVLFANTWMSQLMYKTLNFQKAYYALSFVGKALDTKGPGKPEGFDGIGPVATWYEGTLTYICAGGPGSQMLFDSLIKYRYSDGTVPAYNDNFGGKVDVWAVNWSSLDGTSWLYYAASKGSPFKIYYNAPNIPDEIKSNNLESIEILPNPSSGKFSISFENSINDINDISIYNSLGIKAIKYSKNQIQNPCNVDMSNFRQGVYYVVVSKTNGQILGKVEIIF